MPDQTLPENLRRHYNVDTVDEIKLVGDEVTALFIPGYAGKDHAHKGKILPHARPE